MERHKIYVTIGITVESDLPKEETIDYFQQECDYKFMDTESVKVLHTEWIETSTQL